MMQIRDPLYTNSLFLILSTLITQIFGFVFWLIAARLYSKSDVGIITTLLSSITLITLLSRLGFDQSLIRSFPNGDRGSIIYSTVLVTSIFSLILGLIFVLLTGNISNELIFAQDNVLIFLIIVIAVNVSYFFGMTFVAMRKSKYQFIQNLFGGARIIFLFPMVGLGTMGLFLSASSAFVIGILLAIIVMLYMGLLKKKFDKNYLKSSFFYSMGNYISGLLLATPSLILPLIVINQLGSALAAEFYIIFTLASILFTIPVAIGTSMFVECSHGVELRKSIIKSLGASYLLLVPLILGYFLVGDWGLSLFGQGYAQNGEQLLTVLALSSLFYPINEIFYASRRYEKDTHSLVLTGIVFFLSTIIFSIWQIKENGLIGIGYAWILALALTTFSIAFITWVGRSIYRNRRISTDPPV